MANLVRLYMMNNCPYCTKLKDLLNNHGIAYIEVNVDTEPGALEFINIQKITQSDMLPTVIVGNKALVPEKTFITIEQCFSLIQSLLEPSS